MATQETALDQIEKPAEPKLPPRQRVKLLWMHVDNLSFDETVERIIQMCRRSEPSYIVTPNVDHFVRARTDLQFRDVYENAHLCLADGMPVVWSSRLMKTPIKEKVSGSDLFVKLCERASDEGLRVFLLGAAPGVAEKAKAVLEAINPGLQIVGTFAPMITLDGKGPQDDEIFEMMQRTRPHLVFLAFGTPKQEIWLSRHYRKLGVPVAIGVGASFDFVAGVQSRAPRWMQRCGLEWFWRLVHEPRRLWKRYLVNDMPFFWYVAKERIRRLLRKR